MPTGRKNPPGASKKGGPYGPVAPGHMGHPAHVMFDAVGYFSTPAALCRTRVSPTKMLHQASVSLHDKPTYSGGILGHSSLSETITTKPMVPVHSNSMPAHPRGYGLHPPPRVGRPGQVLQRMKDLDTTRRLCRILR